MSWNVLMWTYVVPRIPTSKLPKSIDCSRVREELTTVAVQELQNIFFFDYER